MKYETLNFIALAHRLQIQEFIPRWGLPHRYYVVHIVRTVPPIYHAYKTKTCFIVQFVYGLNSLHLMWQHFAVPLVYLQWQSPQVLPGSPNHSSTKQKHLSPTDAFSYTYQHVVSQCIHCFKHAMTLYYGTLCSEVIIHHRHGRTHAPMLSGPHKTLANLRTTGTGGWQCLLSVFHVVTAKSYCHCKG